MAASPTAPRHRAAGAPRTRLDDAAELAARQLSDAGRRTVVAAGTSGLLVVARTPGGFASLSEQMTERRIARTYVGMVCLLYTSPSPRD